MSQLACCSTLTESCDASPVILHYPAVARRLASFDFEPQEDVSSSSVRQSPLDRARLEHRNRCCPNCRRITVHAVELDDALLNRWGMAIPGSATVVGFACRSCGHAWTTDRLRIVAAAD